MKLLAICFQLILSAQLFASIGPENIVSNVAKEIRKDLWQKRHIGVESKIYHLSVKDLEAYLGNTSFYERPSKKGLEIIQECALVEDCEVFQITVTSSFHSGYIKDGHLVAVNTSTGDFEVLSHNIYAE